MNANIQYQDHGGVWQTVTTVDNDPVRVVEAMKSLKISMPGYRIRAVDDSGRMIDYLG
jgi:hypothetical protein